MALSEITNYIEDDWDDNNLTGRTGSEEGYYLHPSDNLISDFEAGSVLKGVYRPDWEITDGSPSVSNGSLVLDSDGNVVTPSELQVGEISTDVTFTTTDANSWSFGLNLMTRLSDSANFRILLNDGGEFDIRGGPDSNSNGTIINSSWSIGNNTYSVRMTRTSFGEFELFKDGVSNGTATDTFIFDSTVVAINNYSPDGGLSFEVDNLVVQ